MLISTQQKRFSSIVESGVEKKNEERKNVHKLENEITPI
jgi:hypothetical protein